MSYTSKGKEVVVASYMVLERRRDCNRDSLSIDPSMMTMALTLSWTSIVKMIVSIIYDFFMKSQEKIQSEKQASKAARHDVRD